MTDIIPTHVWLILAAAAVAVAIFVSGAICLIFWLWERAHYGKG